MTTKQRKTIPIKFSPAFFITAGLIGFINSFSLIGTIVWIGIILISVLVHEYGHALTSLIFGQHPKIELVAFGGVTIPEGKKLPLGKEFLVVLMGPVFGFLLFFLSAFVARLGVLPPFAQQVVIILAIVNLFWTVINLLPILPLDGGQLVRIILEKLMGARSFRVSLYVSIVLGGLLAGAAFVIGYLFVGVIFLLLTFQNIETLRRFHYYSEADGQDQNRQELRQIEMLLRDGRIDEAEGRLDHLVRTTKEGLIHTIASEYLAKLLYNKRHYKLAYQLLKPIQKRISKEARCLLFLASYEVQDFDKVIDLSGECFSERQTVDVALRAAASHARKNERQEALEWLKTAKGFGTIDLGSITQDEAFDPLRDDPEFKRIVES